MARADLPCGSDWPCGSDCAHFRKQYHDTTHGNYNNPDPDDDDSWCFVVTCIECAGWVPAAQPWNMPGHWLAAYFEPGIMRTGGKVS